MQAATLPALWNPNKASGSPQVRVCSSDATLLLRVVPVVAAAFYRLQ